MPRRSADPDAVQERRGCLRGRGEGVQAEWGAAEGVCPWVWGLPPAHRAAVGPYREVPEKPHRHTLLLPLPGSCQRSFLVPGSRD